MVLQILIVNKDSNNDNNDNNNSNNNSNDLCAELLRDGLKFVFSPSGGLGSKHQLPN